jgi:hypothetical protein
MIRWSRASPSTVSRLNGYKPIRLLRCRWLSDKGVFLVQEQSAIRCDMPVAKFTRGLGPLLRLRGMAEGFGHLGHREEQHLERHQIVIGVGEEKGAAGIVEDFG